MASGGSGGVSVPALWSEVNRYGQNSDFTHALKTINKILQINKDAVTALHCEVVCLIQNGNFKEALNVINTHTKVLANNSLSFEKAYCEYRLNRIENALKTIESVNQQTDKLKELYGQVLYRSERYDECLAVYRDLVRNSQDDYDEERKTNLSAVVAAQSNWEKVVPENLALQEGTHELCYNTACALIGQGQLNEAMKILQKAEDLCCQSFSEDSDGKEEDPQTELAIIHGQMAYILQFQGRTEEAFQLCNQIIKLKPTDAGLVAVIANNIITINKDQNVFDSKKKLKISQGNISKAYLILRSTEELKHKPGMVSALVTMYSHEEDPEKAKALSKHLPSSDSMSLKVDVEALENSPGATYIQKKGGKVTGDSQPKEQSQGDLKKKKKKGKVPKNYDPKVNPDPERWLPMQERSYYRGRKKEGKEEDEEEEEEGKEEEEEKLQEKNIHGLANAACCVFVEVTFCSSSGLELLTSHGAAFTLLFTITPTPKFRVLAFWIPELTCYLGGLLAGACAHFGWYLGVPLAGAPM
ncbi:Signal recognition particle 72 kDa protein [Heterocephalus glaber]|uniref:Signal recognition particle subunit SRP72 n=1 Tax=Heterocephalus glaber TaxID=10181 RepID=G5AWL1_HETGA|nr:Signal recognition particle 72 kDa protein [Heterocephalus glaber]